LEEKGETEFQEKDGVEFLQATHQTNGQDGGVPKFPEEFVLIG
jgi:hypothetical protein